MFHIGIKHYNVNIRKIVIRTKKYILRFELKKKYQSCYFRIKHIIVNEIYIKLKTNDLGI